ncbi:hypothetical protein EVAR_44556_1 [Eumeta japonica]|uniref:Uncharacterized protein n=1 Tax=Eumeta variegata TaxID=151549 RepID=A0A4C1XA03_EUMVA|nr:hypothetical protein EVAR_44556_1 [Eumeta japonica]
MDYNVKPGGDCARLPRAINTCARVEPAHTPPRAKRPVLEPSVVGIFFCLKGAHSLSVSAALRLDSILFQNHPEGGWHHIPRLALTIFQRRIYALPNLALFSRSTNKDNNVIQAVQRASAIRLPPTPRPAPEPTSAYVNEPAPMRLSPSAVNINESRGRRYALTMYIPCSDSLKLSRDMLRDRSPEYIVNMVRRHDSQPRPSLEQSNLNVGCATPGLMKFLRVGPRCNGRRGAARRPAV